MTQSKMSRKFVAAYAVVALMFGGAAVAVSQPQAEAGAAHAKVCVEKKGWKVPSRAMALCDAVAGHAAYWSLDRSNWTAIGWKIVRECRDDAKNEAKDWGRKDGDRYAVQCLRGNEEYWLEQQPKK